MLLTLLFAHMTFIAMAPTLGYILIDYPTPVRNPNAVILLRVIPLVEKAHNEQQAKEAYAREKALGDFQFRPIMIDDVNRILGYNKYVHTDALDINKAIEMFCIYQNHYNPSWDLRRGAYLWVGGAGYESATPDQWKKLNAYWNKVKKRI